LADADLANGTGAARIGTAGWAIPAEVRDHFPAEGTALERYAARFDAVEINSSFHRPHRRATWERWAAAVPPGFAFAVKLPRAITHTARLAATDDLLAAFADQALGLGDKLAVILVQLPPSLALDPAIAAPFFERLAGTFPDASIACEPRNAAWFTSEADALLAALHVARVAADPAILPIARAPGGWPGLRYRRLHGAPVIYRSAYEAPALAALAADMAKTPRATPDWCMFDNTASGAATADALALQVLLESQAALEERSP
jgi:uncharacterized protein YecE (DUF72 family)